MTKQDAAVLRRALARWENEGGAATRPAQAPEGTPLATAGGDARVDLTNAELVQLQLRVIALENLVTALLAVAPEDTADLVRAIARSILPRPDATPHHLTTRAAAGMIHLLGRGEIAKHARRR